MEDPNQKTEFHCVHCLGRKDRNRPSPILARLLCCAYCEEVSPKANRKLKDTNFAILKDILNDLFYQNSQVSKLKLLQKKKGSKCLHQEEKTLSFTY